jgi:hypothetical protein
LIFFDTKIIIFYLDHKPEDQHERSRIEKAGYKVTLDGRVSGKSLLDRFYFGARTKRRRSRVRVQNEVLVNL